MSSGDDYLFRAAELLARADYESDPEKRAELENLGWAFLRLAGEAEQRERYCVRAATAEARRPENKILVRPHALLRKNS
jgi:hypothetical protein